MVWTIVLAGIALSVLAYVVARQADDARVQSALELRAEWRARDFERKIRLSAYPVEVLAALLSAEARVDPGLFHRFAIWSHRPTDSIGAFGWAPVVTAADRDNFVARARASGQADFDIVERGPNGRLIHAGERAQYLPYWLSETFDGQGGAIGVDVLSVTERVPWVEKARDTGEPVAGPYTLIRPAVNGTPANIMAYLVYAPTYAGGEPPATIDQRRAAFNGLLTGRFPIAATLSAAIQDTPDIVEQIDFFVSLDQSGAAPLLVAHYDPLTKTFQDGGPTSVVESGAVAITRGFDIFGRHWSLVSHFSPAAAAEPRSSAPWSWLVMGLLLTALMAAYVHRERGRRLGIEAMVAARTADLSRTVAELNAANRERQHTQQQLVQAQKMEAVGSLTGGIAHDFNNLLGVVIGNLDLLQPRLASDVESGELLQDALDAATRGADLTRRLLAFARRQPLQPQRVELNDLVAGIVKLLSRTLGEAIEISLDLSPEVWPVMVDPAQLEASLTNLATNARDAMSGGGKLMIATMNRHLDADYAAQFAEVTPGDYALIEVSDTGSGMSVEVMNRIFEPFFTTKPVGKGTGLGLSMVFGFMKQSGGHINVYSEPGVGTTFRLFLPRVAQLAAGEDARVIDVAAPGRGETVLAVEDNAALRRVVLRQLGDLGYRALEAENAAAALALLEREKIDLLFTDVIMAGAIDGYALAREARARWPHLKVVLTSGFPQTKLNGDHERGDEFRLLSKPYRREELARVLREVLDT